MKDWFFEEIYSDFYKQAIKKDTEILACQTQFQKLEIFENSFFGKVLALDDIVQTTTKDEYFYHEMFSHVPLISHGNPQNVLIIGAGDGGILREVIKHSTIKKALMIEIDEEVTKYCKKLMPELNNGAFNHPKSEVRFIDGIKYVCETSDKFDVIIVDSTDPVGAAQPLFTERFYKNCARILNEGGIIANQSGVPFYQCEELINIKALLANNFKSVTFFGVPVPTYAGGFMTLSFASNTVNPRALTLEEIITRVQKANLGVLKYYNPEVHFSSFLLPEYIKRHIIA